MQHHEAQKAACHALLYRAPLVHGTRNPRDFSDIVFGGELKTRTALQREPSDTEEYLGLTDVVYTSAGILYPQRNFAFVFSAELERVSAADASPWDTGHIVNRPGLPPLSSPARRNLFLRYRLAAPHYRAYFVEYVASCFTCPEDYLLGRDHRFSDPARILHRGPDGARSRCFEVRFAGNVQLGATTLRAVFHSVGSDNGRCAGALRKLKQAGVPVISYAGGRDTLADEVARWIVQHLQNERRRLS